MFISLLGVKSMNNMEKTKYKSWGSLKKQMNDLLCDSLKDEIDYFYTSYHSVHNSYGRATINYKKKEIVAFSWDIGYSQFNDEYNVLNEKNVNARTLGSWQSVAEWQIEVRKDLMKEKWMPECKLCDADFIDAITTYLNIDVSTSLNSDNYLLRVFAYMDRRVGKRTLVKIRDEVETLPEWVKQFYNLRCEAEGLSF